MPPVGRSGTVGSANKLGAEEQEDGEAVHSVQLLHTIQEGEDYFLIKVDCHQ